MCRVVIPSSNVRNLRAARASSAIFDIRMYAHGASQGSRTRSRLGPCGIEIVRLGANLSTNLELWPLIWISVSRRGAAWPKS